jgi:hypothetical protein
MIVFHDISSRKMLAREQLRAEVAEETNRQLQTEISEREKAEHNRIRIKKYTNSIINSSLDMIERKLSARILRAYSRMKLKWAKYWKTLRSTEVSPVKL